MKTENVVAMHLISLNKNYVTAILYVLAIAICLRPWEILQNNANIIRNQISKKNFSIRL